MGLWELVNLSKSDQFSNIHDLMDICYVCVLFGWNLYHTWTETKIN